MYVCRNKIGVFILAQQLQYSPSTKDTLDRGHLCKEDTVCSSNHIELFTIYAGQPTGSQYY